ncbi:hypothetical protein CDAR_376761 [Caerostris darwini]|uniref:Uncharacterized protein n=1 Tax=Caerostris darwini TaxID=1538125 RepID=A0AAV4PCI2_9ARAC|nr:hypothetical protein CDAR_376761 [Caerostris darwini]
MPSRIIEYRTQKLVLLPAPPHLALNSKFASNSFYQMPYIKPPRHILPTPKRRLRFTRNRKNKAEGISNANIDSYPTGTHGIRISHEGNRKGYIRKDSRLQPLNIFQLPQLRSSDNKMGKFVAQGIFRYVCLKLTGIISGNIEIGSF